MKKKKVLSIDQMSELESKGEAKRVFSAEEFESRFGTEMAEPPKAEAVPADSYNPGSFDSAGMDAMRNGILLGYGPQFEAAMDFLVGKGLQGKEHLKSAVGLDGDPSKYEIDPYVERRDKAVRRYEGHKENSPKTWLAGNVAGGTLGMVGGAGLLGAMGKTAKAAAPLTKMARIGKAAKIGAGYGAVMNPGDKIGEINPIQAGDRLAAAAVGAGTGAVVQTGLEGAGALVKGGRKGLQYLGEKLKARRGSAELAELQATAKKLGIPLTPGMESDAVMLQGMESSLDQSPSLAGELVRRQTDKTRAGFQQNLQKLTKDASELSPYQVGGAVKKGITGKVGERSANAGAIFDEVRNAARGTSVDSKSLGRIKGNILKMQEVKIGGNTAGKAVAERLDKVKTLEDLTFVRRLVGKELADARRGQNSVDAMALGKVYDKLTKLEENSLKRAIMTLPKTTQKVLDTGDKRTVVYRKAMEKLDLQKDQMKSQLGSMREGKKQYRELMGDTSEFSKNAKLRRSNSPTQFLDVLEDTPNEALVKKMTKVNDVDSMEAFKKLFPKEFDKARGSAVQGYKTRLTNKGGDLSAAKLRQAKKSWGAEARDLIFGKGSSEHMDDIVKVADSIPDKMGPSGTAQAQQMQNSWNPIFQGKELGRYGLYKGLQNPKFMDWASKNANMKQGSALPEAMFKNPGKMGAIGSASRMGFEDSDGSPKRQSLFRSVVKNPKMIDNVQNEQLKEKLREYVERQKSFTKEKVDEQEARDQYVEGN